MLTGGDASRAKRRIRGMTDRRTHLFRTWLASEMQNRRLSQEQLALRSGMHRSTISRLLSGERSPNLDTVAQIVDALGTSPAAASPLAVASDSAAEVERSIQADPALSEATRLLLIQLYRRMRRPLVSGTAPTSGDSIGGGN